MSLFPRARRRALIAASAVGTVTFAIGVLLPAVNAQAAAGCSVTYVANTWPGGFTANITIRNVGDPINGWTLGFAFPDSGQRVGQGWSANWTQSGVNVTATNVSYNGSLPTNASTNIGFNGTWTNANPDPRSFTLNGTVCNGTVNPTSAPPSSRPPSSPPPSSPPPSSPPPSSSGPIGNTPVAINGQLRVCGVNLCNRFNRPIQLRGMSTHGLQWFANCYNDASLNALATDWGSDFLRISMYVQEMGYETNPAAFTAQVNNLVEEATERGLYAIVDFHILTPGDPMFNLERARTFFTAVSQRHAAKNNVIYEIANEPNGVSWATIKSYAEQIIPVIRANAPNAPVIVGTRAWSSLGISEGSNANEVINNPVNAQNIMYAFHFYAASHRDNYRAEVDRAAALIPLFVSEFGTVTFTGGGTFDAASSTAWLDLLDRRRISYANWTYSDADESSAALRAGSCASGNFGTSALSESGNFMRNRIRTPDNFPTS